NQRKRQNRFDDDEKRVINGDRPFTKAKRSNSDVLDWNELQNIPVWRRCCIRQFLLFSNSKRMETPTLLLHQNNNKPLVTLENGNVETEPEKEEFSDPLPIFDDYTHKPMAGNPSIFELISQFEKDSEKFLNNDEFSGPLNALDIGAYDLGLGSFVSMQEGPDEEQNCGHQANQESSSSIQKPDQTQELLEEESDQTEFRFGSYAIFKSGDLQFSRIWAVRIVQPMS
uniref:Uncharacterized protein n=1 Tax=Brassica oleracea var. oleracea TaxID=109376 RepID=A0A0D3E398_BRAOL